MLWARRTQNAGTQVSEEDTILREPRSRSSVYFWRGAFETGLGGARCPTAVRYSYSSGGIGNSVLLPVPRRMDEG